MASTFVHPCAVAQEKAPLTEKALVGMVGNNSYAKALSCYLRGQGFPIIALGAGGEAGRSDLLAAKGSLNGRFAVEDVAATAESLLAECATVFLAEHPLDYGEVAWALAPWLRPGHVVILHNGGFAASVEFSNLIRGHGAFGVKVLEMDSCFSFAELESDCLRVGAINQWALFSAENHSEGFLYSSQIRRFFPKAELAQNLLQRGLSDFVSLLDPLVYVANMSAIARGAAFDLYGGAFTEKSVLLAEQLQKEICLIANAYHIDAAPISLMLKRSYGCDGTSIKSALNTACAFANSRILTEERLANHVGSTYVPLRELACLANLRTPVIDSVISIASVLCGSDFLVRGRTLSKLGFQGMGPKEIVNSVNG
ncbi:MAG TPA: NAD/NADP octopine/nopaline dehydrogenase family protein [Candidatus Obscuribacterales bacterium]